MTPHKSPTPIKGRSASFDAFGTRKNANSIASQPRSAFFSISGKSQLCRSIFIAKRLSPIPLSIKTPLHPPLYVQGSGPVDRALYVQGSCMSRHTAPATLLPPLYVQGSVIIGRALCAQGFQAGARALYVQGTCATRTDALATLSWTLYVQGSMTIGGALLVQVSCATQLSTALATFSSPLYVQGSESAGGPLYVQGSEANRLQEPPVAISTLRLIPKLSPLYLQGPVSVGGALYVQGSEADQGALYVQGLTCQPNRSRMLFGGKAMQSASVNRFACGVTRASVVERISLVRTRVGAQGHAGMGVLWNLTLSQAKRIQTSRFKGVEIRLPSPASHQLNRSDFSDPTEPRLERGSVHLGYGKWRLNMT